MMAEEQTQTTREMQTARSSSSSHHRPVDSVCHTRPRRRYTRATRAAPLSAMQSVILLSVPLALLLEGATPVAGSSRQVISFDSGSERGAGDDMATTRESASTGDRT
eukprot:7976483-Pyramimonas_sp.AAC.2